MISIDYHERPGVHVLPALPYARNALEPIISARTLSFHYGKHHAGYIDTLNRLIAGTAFEALSLEQLMAASAGKADLAAIFNSAAQAWNHSFYWRSLRPKGGGTPPAALRHIIEGAFGSVETCKNELARAAANVVGNGWVWLVLFAGHIKVLKTNNAETPLNWGMQPLLTLDVWEHAYYLDYQNRRADYFTAVIDKLINWDFVAENLSPAFGMQGIAEAARTARIGSGISLLSH